MRNRDEAQTPSTPDEWRAFTLKLIGSMTLAETRGDMAETVLYALTFLEIEININEMEEGGTLGEIGDYLGVHHGVTTLYGTSLVPEEE